jgi:hypothetical protein
MEVEAAAYTVHSPIFTEDNKLLEKDGDAKLRSNFHHRMCDVLRDNGFKVRSMPLP